MTTPAQDAPLVFPHVAFRPVRLLIICVVLTGLVTLGTGLLGRPMFGVFFGVGLLLGLVNGLLVQRSVGAITAQDHPLKKKMAVNSATRLLLLTGIGLVIAYFFRPAGIGVVFGMALFQVILVFSTSLPVLRAMKAENAALADADGGQPRND